MITLKTLKTCGSCEHFPGNYHCIKCVWDEDKQGNTKWELKKNPIVIERRVLDEIRAEIIQLIQNGILKIESGNEALFNIINKYKAESEE